MAKTRQWKFDGDLTDDVGSADMSAVGSLAYQPGIFGQSLSAIAGARARVAVGSHSDLNPGANDFSCSVWLYFDGTLSGGNDAIVSVWDYGASHRVWLLFMDSSTGQLNLWASYNGTSVGLQLISQPLTAGLYKVGVSKTGSTYVLNVNGAPAIASVIGTPSATLHTAAASSEFTVLGYQSGIGASFDNGWVDNIEYWDEGLTDAQFLAQYNASLAVYAPYFDFDDAAHAPDDADTGVGTGQKLGIVVEDDYFNIPLADVDLRLTRGDGEEQVYLSSAYVAPYTGDTPVANASGRGWKFVDVYRTGGWFEDLDIVIRGVIGSDMDEDYTFEVETRGFFRNSGAEAPGATADLAKAWTFVGDVIRTKNPTNWPSPPEGDHVFLLFDTVDLTFPANSTSVNIRTQSLDLTDVVFIQFWEHSDYPTIDTDDKITHRVYIDDELIYVNEMTDADSGIDETVLRRVFGFAAYTGVHTLRAAATFHKDGQQVWVEDQAVRGDFDGGTLEHESFTLWSGLVQAWVEGSAVKGLFDDDATNHEDFDFWSGLFQFWTEGSAVKGLFDDDATNHEDFDAWAT